MAKPGSLWIPTGIEAFPDGTYVFYYKFSDTDFRVIVCDEYGNWGIRRYADGVAGCYSVSQMRSDLSKLKIRIYRYAEGNTQKNVKVQGPTTFYADFGTSLANIMNRIQYDINVFDANTMHPIPGNGTAGKVGYYTLDAGSVNTSVAGTYTVKIWYHNDATAATQVGTVKVVVDGTINSSAQGAVSQNAYETTKVHQSTTDASYAYFMYGGEMIKIELGMLSVDGKAIDTSIADKTYQNVTVTYQGTVIRNDFTLYVGKGTLAIDVPVYNESGSVKVDKFSNTTDSAFSSTGVANIQLSAAGVSTSKPLDLIIVMDLSSSMLYAPDGSTEVTGHKYDPKGNPNTTGHDASLWNKTRLYALQKSLQDMINDMKATGADVRIALTDFGDIDHFEFSNAVMDGNIRDWPHMDVDGDGVGSSGDILFDVSNHLNYILGRDDELFDDNTTDSSNMFISQPFMIDRTKYDTSYSFYNGKTNPYIYTGDKMLNADAFQSVTTINLVGNGTLDSPQKGSVVDQMNVQSGKRLGTNYDIGLETAYRLAHARQLQNQSEGVNREIVCIFMSDGAAMQYNYFSGRSYTEAWSQYLIGNTDEILETSKDAYSWQWGSPSKWPAEIFDRTKEMHERLHAGNLDCDGATGGAHFDKTKVCTKGTDGGQAFFQCLQGQGGKWADAYWAEFFEILWYNTDNNDTDSIGGGRDYYYSLMSSLRKPKHVDANNDGTGDYAYQTYSPYYYFYNKDGKNWWAEAIKGDPTKVYPVINRYAVDANKAKPSNWDLSAYYAGEVTNKFNGPLTEGLALKGQEYVSGFKGLGLKLFTIGFSLADERRIQYEEATTVLDNVASGMNYHYEADSQEELTAALRKIITSSGSAASNAYFTDTMGSGFDLSTEKTVTHLNGTVITVNNNPQIKVMRYDLDANGNRTGAATVLETITFQGGKVAYSDMIYTTDDNGNKVYTDIWNDDTGLISGKRVIYNTNTDASVDLVLDNSGRKFSLKPETFFWIVGLLADNEVVLEYQAYLTGSADGELTGSMAQYATNKEAILYYTDYLGNSAKKETVSPEFYWASDAVVIDYGIPVQIGVPHNYTSTNTIVGVRKGGDLPGIVNGSIDGLKFGTSITGAFGKMEVVDGKLKYTPGTMSISGSDAFVYVIEENGEYYFSAVYVLPATIVYYEDNFVDLDVVDKDGNEIKDASWSTAGSTVNKVQDEDRPGEDKNDALGNLDMDSIYGFDTNCKNFAQYSLGSAAKITVSAGRAGKASFSFWGTGFDVVSLSSCDTGTIVVKVTDAAGNYIVNYLVDTYYGYKFDGENCMQLSLSLILMSSL